jgi:RNA polymerase sigma-70 factor (ECF subfamily)
MRMDMDTILLDDIQAFTKQSLEGMYEDHSPGIFRYAYRMLGDPNLAEECVSESFSRYLHAVKKGKEPRENPKAYLYRIAHNWIIDHYRRQPPVTVSLESEQIADESQNPARLVMQKYEQNMLRHALLQLPDDQQKVVLLRVLEKMPHEEVAEILGRTVEATRSLQYRALAALRRILVDVESNNG